MKKRIWSWLILIALILAVVMAAGAVIATEPPGELSGSPPSALATSETSTTTSESEATLTADDVNALIDAKLADIVKRIEALEARERDELLPRIDANWQGIGIIWERVIPNFEERLRALEETGTP